ncbi:phosphomannomutase/phosphoglucomutase, partial [Candidatus Woesearchaeota archaeon]|nr:phosphomannomutase/phosphoglucomutase [Candidatus Woesearchaeota archaeon]
SLIIKNLLGKNPGSNVIHNLVCSKIVPDTIEKFGGKVIKERVGHSYIKDTMRRTNSIFACEHSAHYYYKSNFNADSGIITSMLIVEIVSKENKKLSELLEEFKVYHTIEETNSKVEDKMAKMDEIVEKYKDTAKEISRMDGVSCEFGNWRFNVRPSNTEPLLRLNLEADSEQLMNEKKEELLGIMRN